MRPSKIQIDLELGSVRVSKQTETLKSLTNAVSVLVLILEEPVSPLDLLTSY